MRAGLLNTMITILYPQKSRNEYGETVFVYEKKGTARAQIMNQAGNRTISNDEIFYSYQKTFRVRRYVKIDDVCQVLYNGQKYRVISIDDDRETNCKIVRTELVNE